MKKTEVSEIEQPEFRTSFDSVDSSDSVEVAKSNLESLLDGNEDTDDDEIDGDKPNAVLFDVNKKSPEGCRDEDIDKAVSSDLVFRDSLENYQANIINFAKVFEIIYF